MLNKYNSTIIIQLAYFYPINRLSKVNRQIDREHTTDTPIVDRKKQTCDIT